jgi:hypothetical protein
MLAGKDRSLPKKRAAESFSSQISSGLVHKYKTRLERDKCTGLIGLVIKKVL